MANRDMTNENTDLRRMSDLDDFKVADGYPDIRGWDVKTPDGQKLGEVKDLVVSVSEMRVRYVDVKVDRALRGTASTDEDGHALVPIGTAQLDDTRDDIVVNNLGSDLSTYPRYAGQGISRDYETQLHSRMSTGGMAAAGAAAATTAGRGANDMYGHDHYDDQRLFAKRRQGRTAGADERLTLSEEELRVGKRQTQAGEVELRKTVETEHVTKQVPLSHEEVSVERRPLSGADAQNARIGENQEISVPVMREEAVVNKQAVAREEIIVRKQAVTENKTVEADLRKERLDVDRNVDRDVSRASGTAAGTGQSLGDKVKNAADNLKDRIDGDPSTRPGPDRR